MGSVAARKRAAFGNALREAAAALGLAHEGTDPAVEDAAELDADFDGPQQVAAFDLEEDRCRDRLQGLIRGDLSRRRVQAMERQAKTGVLAAQWRSLIGGDVAGVGVAETTFAVDVIDFGGDYMVNLLRPPEGTVTAAMLYGIGLHLTVHDIDSTVRASIGRRVADDLHACYLLHPVCNWFEIPAFLLRYPESN